MPWALQVQLGSPRPVDGRARPKGAPEPAMTLTRMATPDASPASAADREERRMRLNAKAKARLVPSAEAAESAVEAVFSKAHALL